MTLDAEDKAVLAGIVRKALGGAAAGRPYAAPADPGRPALREKRGVFVTLKTDGQLRGCLGCFASDQPLYETAAAYARHSALDDPRFRHRRLTAGEAETAEADLSVLTPLAPCPEPENIVLGRDGIYVSRDGRSGCFLPQVAEETGWSAEEFWGHCCRDKAGLAWDAWRQPGTAVMIFTAEVFSC